MRVLISSGLILLFLAMQLSVLHEFSHDDNSIPCKICLVSHQAQSLDYTAPQITQAPHTTWIFIEQDIDGVYALAKANLFSYSYLSRPPPVDC